MVLSLQQSAQTLLASSGQPSSFRAPDGKENAARALALPHLLLGAGFTMERRPPN